MAISVSRNVIAYLIVISVVILFVSAQEANNCDANDTIDYSEFGNYQSTSKFIIKDWMDRGRCARSSTATNCYATLVAYLTNLNPLHQAEYSGSVTVLTLLPSIGALFGAPTTEIWTMLTIIPFGGWIALLLSFGGTVTPVKVEDYTLHSPDGEGSTFSIMPGESGKLADEERIMRRHEITRRIRTRLSLERHREVISKALLIMALVTMVILLAGAQVAMWITETGAVLEVWCACNWWMHLWYVLVTLTSITESFTNVPFSKSWKLHICKPPYDLSVTSGENVRTGFAHQDPETQSLSRGISRVGTALSQIATLSPAMVTFIGSTQPTDYRHAVMLIISVADIDKNIFRTKSLFRVVSRIASVIVFLMGTILFASANLLAVPIAQMVVILVVSCGIFGRAISSGIISKVKAAEPMVHVVCDTENEAFKVIDEVLALKGEDEGEKEHFQIEIDGHIFLDERRIGRRSKWWIKALGVLAAPYDIRQVGNRVGTLEGRGCESNDGAGRQYESAGKDAMIKLDLVER